MTTPSARNDYQQANSRAWDELVRKGSLFARVATDEECAQPLVTLDSRGWLPGRVDGLKVLCLAAGGGWQSILYAVAGADVTVVDLSEEMLALDIREAEKRNVRVKVVQGSMDNLAAFDAGMFDIVHHPVSTCYIPNLEAVYRQVAHVLRVGGLYISQHKSPTSLQIVERDARNRYVMGISYYHEGALPAVADTAYREAGTVEYLHRWEELIGGLCRTGFVVEDLVEPKRGDPKAKPGHFKHRGMFTAPFVRIKARRIERQPEELGSTLWVPDSVIEGS
ncbi:MAG: class I SAM-dependent methyltransferase [Planctomycetaceae bacterium]